MYLTLMNSILNPIFIRFLGGLGLFFYGIHLLSETLQKMSSHRLKEIIQRFTTHPFKGILVGTCITGIIQSSSGTIAITISLVQANLMTFYQAMGIVLGANIGTTVTAFIIGLDIAYYAPLLIGIGALILFFYKKRRVILIGNITLAFGLLFFGMQVMENELAVLATSPTFQSLMISFSHHPIFGFFIGTVLTAIVQSSSVTIALLQSLHINGHISLYGAIPIIFGSNVGTTIKGVLASLNGSKEARKVAYFEVLFNTLGGVLFLLLLKPYYYIITHLMCLLAISDRLSVATSHFVFNVLTTVIAFTLLMIAYRLRQQRASLEAIPTTY